MQEMLISSKWIKINSWRKKHSQRPTESLFWTGDYSPVQNTLNSDFQKLVGYITRRIYLPSFLCSFCKHLYWQMLENKYKASWKLHLIWCNHSLCVWLTFHCCVTQMYLCILRAPFLSYLCSIFLFCGLFHSISSILFFLLLMHIPSRCMQVCRGETTS